MQLLRHLSMIAAVTSVTVFTQLGSSKLWDRDEPRNARCSWEMLERGDWIVPTFNGELRTHKPILLYWLMMSSYTVFGINEFAARFASAALAVGTVLLTYGIGRRLFDPSTAMWSAIILGSTLLFNVAARAATPDSTLIFCGTLAMFLFVQAIPRDAWRREDQPRPLSLDSTWKAIGVYGAMGLAILAKGPVGLVLPTAVIGLFLLIERRPEESRTTRAQQRLIQRCATLFRPFRPGHLLSTFVSMRPLTALAATGVVALPWYCVVGLRTDGEWLRGFFFEHNVGRAMRAMEGHQGSLFYYPIALLIGFFPWSVLALPVGQWSYAQCTRENSRRPTAFLLCWGGVYVLAFTLAQTKLPSYITPIYPAVAILVGCYLSQWLRSGEHSSGSSRWIQVAALCLSLVGVALTIALPIAAHRFLPGEEWLGMVGGIPLLCGLVVFLAVSNNRRRLAASALAVGSLSFMLALFACVAPRVSHYQQIEQLLASAGPLPQRQLASYAAHEPSWVFYAGHSMRFFRRGQQWQAVDFLTSQPTACLITTERQFVELRPQMPSSIEVVHRVPYFLEDEQLVLLRNTERTSQTPAPASHSLR